MFVIRSALEGSAKLSADDNGFAIEIDLVTFFNPLFTAAREQQAKLWAGDATGKEDGKAMAKEGLPEVRFGFDFEGSKVMVGREW